MLIVRSLGVVEQNLWLDGPFRFANTILVNSAATMECRTVVVVVVVAVVFASDRRLLLEASWRSQISSDGQFPSFPL